MALNVEIVEQPIRILMESDLWQIILAFSSLIIAAITAYALWFQIQKQSNVSSANLILELLKPWRTKQFQKLLYEIADPEITQYDEKELEKFLNQLEDIATFWKDKTLSETHVKEFFGTNLKTIQDDTFIQNYIKRWNDKNPKYFFANLKLLLNKVNNWKI